ncbi:PDZ domain-containing protein [Formicincola oecophyllae]|uniref:PDZ domain-containing protein n=2 Tax=Formicincola oecophyllae TaxID=2558361 RepID=A0A4Y6UCW2_9PROT|nr:PDZ domain-containing protein [Formicincola oecophyllae]
MIVPVGPDGQPVAAAHHRPLLERFRRPIPVSPALVLPQNAPSLAGRLLAADVKHPILVDLPSFSPLVRLVIPAVVNISVGDGDAVTDDDEAGDESNDDDASADEEAPPAHTAPLRSHHREKHKRATPPPPHHARKSTKPRSEAHAKPKAPTKPAPKANHPHAAHPHERSHDRTPPAKTPAKKVGKRPTQHVPPKAKRRGAHGLLQPAALVPGENDGSSAGSGFIIDPSGIVVTNLHVIGHSPTVTVSLSDGRILKAHSIGDDPMTDIAVLKVDSSEPLPSVPWGDSNHVDIGDWILVAGNPFGFGSSVTAGIISAIGRDLGIGPLDNFMQIDAPINPGNSGGPAFNLRGEVVAMNAAIASPSDGSVGIGFGIPSAIVAVVVDEIVRTGHVRHGWAGIILDETTTPILVADVEKNGPAWKAGVRTNDRLLAVGGVKVTSARTIFRSIATARPGDRITFTVKRADGTHTYPVVLGPHPPMRYGMADGAN